MSFLYTFHPIPSAFDFKMTESILKKESKKHHNCTIFVGIGTQYGRSNSKKKANDYHTIEVQNHPDLKFKKQD